MRTTGKRQAELLKKTDQHAEDLLDEAKRSDGTDATIDARAARNHVSVVWRYN